MKRCQNCGAEHEDDKKFCKYCGSPLSEIDETAKQNGKKQVKKGEKERNPSGQKPEKKKKKKLWLILILILVAALFCGGIFAVYMIQEKRLEEVKKEQERREKEIEEERKEEEKERKKAEQKEKEKEKKEAEEQEQKEKELKEQLQKKEEELEKVQKQAEEKNQSAQSSSNSSSGMSAGEWWDSQIASAEETDAQLSAGVSSNAAFETQMSVAQQRYEVWDALLNEMWSELEAVLPQAELRSLTDEQVSWIQQKEAMLSNYWQGTSTDHSGFPNGPAADLTKERVYYLRGKLPY